MPPTDTEYRQNRQQEIMRLLNEGVRVASQEQLVALLRERGIPATQSSISRDLRALGVYRYGRYYALPPSLEINVYEAERELEFRISAFLDEVRSAGPHILVLLTRPGGAQTLAIALEEMKWGEVVGCIAGDDTIFVATPRAVEQRRLAERLKKLRSEFGR
jgi:transcriptional regulator of arginine metabolism